METELPAVGAPVDCRVGRPVPERDYRRQVVLRPVCWYCDREIHPLDDMHHLWCHGGNP